MKLLLLTLAFVALAVVLLVAYAFTHSGHVGQHVSANKALRRQGIGCVQSQDREARKSQHDTNKQKNSHTS